MRTNTTMLIMLLLSAAIGTASAKKKETVVRMETSAGVIRIRLSNETPRHRDNFIKLVRKGYYDGLLFHRVIKDFMVQTGDPDSRVRLSENGDSIISSPSRRKPLGDGGPGYDLEAEFDLPWLYHVRGAVAAAREADEVNPEMRSSGSQFYIVYGRSWGETSLGKQRAALEEQGIEMTRDMWDDYLLNGGTPHLDGTYTVFGHVIEGMKVVKAMQAVPTDKDDRPLKDIFIRKACVE